MESRIKLAKHALSRVEERSFTLDLSMDDGNWEGYSTEVFVSEPEMLFLLKKKMKRTELFEGLEVEEIDLDYIAKDECYEKYCRGWVSEIVSNIVPKELEALHDRVAEFAKRNVQYKEGGFVLIEDCKEERDEILEAVKAIKDGKYTFEACLIDVNGYIPVEKEVVLEIDAQLARDIVVDCFNTMLDVSPEFKDLVKETYVTEDDLTEEMKYQGDFFEDSIDYDWTSSELDYTLDAWNELIEQILEGRVTEERIEKYIEYLNEGLDLENWENDFKEIANESDEDFEEAEDEE